MSGQYSSLQKGKVRQQEFGQIHHNNKNYCTLSFSLHPTGHKHFKKKIIGLILGAIETLFNPRARKQGGNENDFLLMISHCFHFTQ